MAVIGRLCVCVRMRQLNNNNSITVISKPPDKQEAAHHGTSDWEP